MSLIERGGLEVIRVLPPLADVSDLSVSKQVKVWLPIFPSC
jgi:hypothetical protein